MKTSLHVKQRILTTALLVIFSASCVLGHAQSTEMRFENPSLVSGSNGADGSVYKFSLVNNELDALLTIGGRSSNLVAISNLDIPGQGFAKAFQPQIKYNNGNVTTATTWWIEFQIQFVVKNTLTPAPVNEFYITGLDIDGNSGKLKEWDSFYGGTGYTLESNSLLSVSSQTGTVNLPTLSGKQFLGAANDYAGIDTSATELMTTIQYKNTSSVIIRLGATTTGSVSNANRMYSVWFKNFTYNAPISTLPVKLTAFTAALNKNKVNLKWETASEINTSHFEIERSTDGANFSEAGLVFAYGNATDKANYSFTDDVSSFQQPVVYYRLRSVDADGKSQLSETRIIRIGNAGENTVSLLTYPNPVTHELRVTVPANWQNKQTVFELYNANGQIAKRKTTSGSNQTETVNVSDLAPGFYIVRVNCEGQTAQQKIIKQ